MTKCEWPKDQADYRQCLLLFNAAVAEAVAITTQACGTNQQPTDDNFHKRLGAVYAVRVKTYFESSEPDPFEQKLGIVYSSLVTALNAVRVAWTVRNKNCNSIVANDAFSLSEAIRMAQLHGTEAHRQASELMAAENDLKMKIYLFVALVFEHASSKRICHRMPGFIADYGSQMNREYPISRVEYAQPKKESVRFSYVWHDGTDESSGGLGELYSTDSLREYLQSLADQIFGRKVTFSKDYNSIML